MSQRLFNVGKIPVFLDKCEKGIERRKDGEAKIQRLTLRIQPFTAKLAAALDEGTEVGNIRATVFNMNDGEQKPNFTRHDFTLAIPRQLLECYASTDTPNSRVGLDGVRIHSGYVRIQADMDNLALVVKASFGPASKDELEFLEYWFRGQQAVTFKEGDPSLQWAEDSLNGDDRQCVELEAQERFDRHVRDSHGIEFIDGDAAADDDQPALPAPEFETDAAGRPVGGKEPVRQRLLKGHKHTSPRAKAAAKSGKKKRR